MTAGGAGARREAHRTSLARHHRAPTARREHRRLGLFSVTMIVFFNVSGGSAASWKVSRVLVTARQARHHELLMKARSPEAQDAAASAGVGALGTQQPRGQCVSARTAGAHTQKMGNAWGRKVPLKEVLRKSKREITKRRPARNQSRRR